MLSYSAFHVQSKPFLFIQQGSNFLLDIIFRTTLPPIAMGALAFFGHNYVTGPLAKHAVVGLGMDVFEIASFGVVGVVFGVLAAFREFAM